MFSLLQCPPWSWALNEHNLLFMPAQENIYSWKICSHSLILFRKMSHAWSCRAAHPGIPRSVHSLINTEHRTLTVELWLSWIFLLALYKSICDNEEKLSVWVKREGRGAMCDSFLTRDSVFTGVWAETGGACKKIGAHWGSTLTPQCGIWIHL